MEYQVGEYYDILHVQYLDHNGKFIEYVPVIGEPHSDPQFGGSAKHYHVDGRFIKKKSFLPHENGITNHPVFIRDEAYPFGCHAGEEVTFRAKCLRTTTGLNPPKQGKYPEWYKTYVGRSCAGRKCPHLGHQMLLVNGVLVCPLHNLRGCPEKEIIIEM
jgi:hypothetical protein